MGKIALLTSRRGTKLKETTTPEQVTTKSADRIPAQLNAFALFPWPALIIMLTAFAVIVPFFFQGNPSGHDFEFHLFSWMDVLGQWQHAIVYPRWASLAHWGYGETRFLFYPPASWTLGAALGAFLPWHLAPGAFIWIALTASGFSMFFLARRWLDAKDTIFAAALYAANPYYVVIVYWRSAFAELLAGALLPLLLLFVLRMEQEGRRMVIPLGLVVAAAWLTNAPSAVMVNYSLALLVVVLALIRRSPLLLVYGAIALLIGVLLPAFYVLPAAYEENWVNIAQVLSPGVRPEDNFLFTTLADPDHNRFNLLVSVVAVGEMIVLAGVLWLSRRWRQQQPTGWWMLTAWAIAAILLMFSFTFVFWQHLPKLRFVQLPWRWLLCINVAFALLVTMGARRWFSRIVVCAAMLVVIVAGWHRVQPPWWDSRSDIEEMHDAVLSGQGYEGTDEYVPAGADPYELNKEARRVAVVENVPARIHIVEWGPQTKLFTTEVKKPVKLVLRLFNYPAWKLEVNGRAANPESLEVTGQMVVPIEAGANHVQVTFGRTWDRTAGDTISAVTAVLVLVFFFYERRQRLHLTREG
jgi:6-pyruvoyl-tetrahydropterin synthase-like protein